ncbi:MAG TPA: MBL fold metallo-hydrolase [Burkholderiales bacterium]|nr:MBL fold metallo-hydrolase [Burkholderiales bacterium]
MRHRFIALSMLVLAACAAQPREQALVERAAEAMGGRERLAAIRTFSAKGTFRQWEPEQSEAPDGEMRFGNEGRFEAAVDNARAAARYDYEKRFAYPAPRTFRYSELVTPRAGYVLGVDSNSRNAQSLKTIPPAHSMSSLRLATTQREELRASAAALVAAMSADASSLRPAVDLAAGGAVYPSLSYGPFIVAFDPQSGLPARVRTLDYDNIWGDVNYDVVYSDWRDVVGVKIPMHRRYELNGRVVQEVQLTEARINPPLDAANFQVPEALRADAAPPATGNVPYQWVIRRQFIGIYLDSENTSYDTRASQGLRFDELAPGVFHVVGGTHNSLLVEMSDHLVVVDAPISDAQSLWVLNEAQRRFPGKPVRWLILTHHHMDHAGGLRAYLAQGATLVVGRGAREHFRRVLASPMERDPDMKPADFSQVPIMEVPDSHLISDARGRQVIVYAVQNNPHAQGMLIAYLPEARLGFVSDLWTPGVPLPDKPNAALMSVVNTVDRAHLDPLRFAGGHGGVADYAPLAKLAGQ